MTVHTIPLQANRTFYRDENWYEGTIEYRCKSKHQSGRLTNFAVSFLSAEGKCRREHGGPDVPGPYAFGTALPTVISAHPMAQTPHIDVEVGDFLIIGGLFWQLREDRRLHDPRLVLIDEAELARMRAEADARLAAADDAVEEARTELELAEARLAAHTN
jgi:hypothetical protein